MEATQQEQQQNQNADNTTAAAEKKVVVITEVQQMLKDGKERKEIGEHYGLRPFEVVALFKHPKLKGKKTIKPPVLSFIIEDDTEPSANEVHTTAPANETEQVSEAAAPLS